MTYFIHLTMKMEPTVSSETSAIRTQTPGNYPKRNKLHLEHGESLKTRNSIRLPAFILRLVQIRHSTPDSNAVGRLRISAKSWQERAQTFKGVNEISFPCVQWSVPIFIEQTEPWCSLCGPSQTTGWRCHCTVLNAHTWCTPHSTFSAEWQTP